MQNFNYYNPVRILFGKGKVEELKNHIPQDANILLTYGGGSIKRNGIYEAVVESLKGHRFLEFGGIEANPKYETLMQAVKIVKEQNIDFILAVGGGSVLDGTKFIAAAALFEGDDPWDILAKAAPIKAAVPFGAVLTLAATGSEMNGNFVVSKSATQEKLAAGSEKVYPKFSVLDPEYTFSLPQRQVANGIIDSYVHTMEQYLTYPMGTEVQDALAEGILRILIQEGPKAIESEKPCYENRSTLMWAATNALNGLLSCGVVSDWSSHQIGHELTALHGLDHAVSLAVVLPGVLEFTKGMRSEKLLQYAQNVWNITEGDDAEKCNEAIRKTELFFQQLGVKTRLGDYGIMEDTIDLIVKRFTDRGYPGIGYSGDIKVHDVATILKSRI